MGAGSHKALGPFAITETNVMVLPSWISFPLDLLPPEVCSLLNPAAIYANNEISLSDVEVYGFDYDYTLAQYADALHPEIFNAARDILIEHYKVRPTGPCMTYALD